MGGDLTEKDFKDWLDVRKTGIGDSGCKKPGCPVPNYPKPDYRCICNKPLMLYIPPGEHVHIECPVHGDRIIKYEENPKEQIRVTWK